MGCDCEVIINNPQSIVNPFTELCKLCFIGLVPFLIIYIYIYFVCVCVCVCVSYLVMHTCTVLTRLLHTEQLGAKLGVGREDFQQAWELPK